MRCGNRQKSRHTRSCRVRSQLPEGPIDDAIVWRPGQDGAVQYAQVNLKAGRSLQVLQWRASQPGRYSLARSQNIYHAPGLLGAKGYADKA